MHCIELNGRQIKLSLLSKDVHVSWNTMEAMESKQRQGQGILRGTVPPRKLYESATAIIFLLFYFFAKRLQGILKVMSTKPRFLINIERNIRRGVAQKRGREGRIQVHLSCLHLKVIKFRAILCTSGSQER